MQKRKYIRSFPSLDKRTIFSRSNREDPILSSKAVTFYASARAALFHVIKCLNFQKTDIVLMPAYHCGVEVEAVLRAGCSVEFYPVKNDLSIDYDHLLGLFSAETRGFVAVHYFGFPQDTSRLREICDEKKVVLIEDCAHALYSRESNGKWLGTIGDYGVFSMRKTIFLPNGGAALTNTQKLGMPTRGKSNFDRSHVTTTFRSLLEYEQQRDGTAASLSHAILAKYKQLSSSEIQGFESNAHQDSRWYYDVPLFDYGNDISIISRLLLAKEDFRKLIALRRRNYEILQERLRRRLNLTFFFDFLPDGVCPLFLPVLVTERDLIASRMIERGVEPFIFGRLLHPKIPKEGFETANYLADHVMALPIDQQLTVEDMSTVADVFIDAMKDRV